MFMLREGYELGWRPTQRQLNSMDHIASAAADFLMNKHKERISQLK
jgi:hypothetical protein